MKRKRTVKKTVVTGGAGYVGAGLLRALLKEGHRVVCVDKLLFGGESIIDLWHEPNFVFRKVDINDHPALDEVLAEFDYHTVIHLAAIVGDPACKREPELATETNWESTRYLVDRCKELSIPRFLFASTCSNYGKMSDPSAYVVETSELSPVSLYAELKVKFEKYMMEEMEKSDDFCPVSLRFSTVYGISPRMRFDLTVNEFTKELAMGRELVIFGEQFWRPYCHVKDFSGAFITAMEAPRKRSPTMSSTWAIPRRTTPSRCWWTRSRSRSPRPGSNTCRRTRTRATTGSTRTRSGTCWDSRSP